jgi:hypothetical protein
MSAVKHSALILVSILAGCAFAVFLVISQQYHPSTANRGLLNYGWFSPRVEKTLTTDLLVPSVAAGAGAEAYVRGELDASLSNSLESVANAFDTAIPQLQFTKVSEARTVSSAVIIARTTQDKRIEFRVAAAADNVTKVAILFGDETLARAVLDEIKTNL